MQSISGYNSTHFPYLIHPVIPVILTEAPLAITESVLSSKRVLDFRELKGMRHNIFNYTINFSASKGIIEEYQIFRLCINDQMMYGFSFKFALIEDDYQKEYEDAIKALNNSNIYSSSTNPYIEMSTQGSHNVHFCDENLDNFLNTIQLLYTFGWVPHEVLSSATLELRFDLPRLWSLVNQQYHTLNEFLMESKPINQEFRVEVPTLINFMNQQFRAATDTQQMFQELHRLTH